MVPPDRKSLLRNVDRIRKILKALPDHTPNLTVFCQHADRIKRLAESGSEDRLVIAAREFRSLFRELRNAADGMGGFVLNEKRTKRYLPDVTLPG